uniref:C3H1-type domain-containing protein n=1 Tax=Chromera velia CCMP2878 TaxID=1169474 RepID=A0A0G4G2G8_9ALVE|eukprot:Cvel_4073.t1-p1 / transcript=Cvel_4073.t1 / gene=Cvel_4073 / organism=Chromera_velia_CCMP2878 / gene_product=hypothetical protein / transcript_product=hypothetical protein / location=Cvel_scaffold173:97694-101883(+) / protein_length=686 / sequence_SO=supercontig / SO=protein_coding / is_pseudo=false
MSDRVRHNHDSSYSVPDGMVDVGAAARVVSDAREIAEMNSGGGATQEVINMEEGGGGGDLVLPPNQYVVLTQQRVQLAQSHHLRKANYSKLIHILNLRRWALKTKMCLHYPLGNCKFGLNCNFAHSEVELRPKADLRKCEMCIHALQGFMCPRSAACAFAHNVAEMEEARRLFTCCSPKTVARERRATGQVRLGQEQRGDPAAPPPANPSASASSAAAPGRPPGAYPSTSPADRGALPDPYVHGFTPGAASAEQPGLGGYAARDAGRGAFPGEEGGHQRLGVDPRSPMVSGNPPPLHRVPGLQSGPVGAAAGAPRAYPLTLPPAQHPGPSPCGGGAVGSAASGPSHFSQGQTGFPLIPATAPSLSGSGPRPDAPIAAAFPGGERRGAPPPQWGAGGGLSPHVPFPSYPSQGPPLFPPHTAPSMFSPSAHGGAAAGFPPLFQPQPQQQPPPMPSASAHGWGGRGWSIHEGGVGGSGSRLPAHGSGSRLPSHPHPPLQHPHHTAFPPAAPPRPFSASAAAAAVEPAPSVSGSYPLTTWVAPQSNNNNSNSHSQGTPFPQSAATRGDPQHGTAAVAALHLSAPGERGGDPRGSRDPLPLPQPFSPSPVRAGLSPSPAAVGALVHRRTIEPQPQHQHEHQQEHSQNKGWAPPATVSRVPLGGGIRRVGGVVAAAAAEEPPPPCASRLMRK